MKVVSDRSKEILKAFKALTQARTLVGIPSEKADRKPDPNEPKSEINNATIGFLNEFGMPELNLPARPHLVPGIQRAMPQITETYRKAVNEAATGDAGAAMKAHVRVGVIVTSAVKNFIADGLSPPLADSTLDERKRRGVTRTNPLQDTGQYRNAIDFAIRPAGTVKKRGR